MLSTLPIEILIHIFSNARSAKDIANLSLTCKNLHLAISKFGWKCFLRQNFPDVEIAGHACSDAAHSLVQLSEAWSRRAILGRSFKPSGFIYDIIKGARLSEWVKPRGQTMGYQAQVDSYEESTGGEWDARKEVVACSAGSQLLISVKDMGPEAHRLWASSSERDRELEFDNFQHRNRWLIYAQHGSREGYDDILNVNLIKPYQALDRESNNIDAVIGRANGELSLISAQFSRRGKPRSYKKFSFSTLSKCIRAAHVSPSILPLLAASVSDNMVAIYRLESISSNQAANIHFDAMHTRKPSPNHLGHPSSIEDICFLSEEKLAIGASHADDLKVFQLRSDGAAELVLCPVYDKRIDGLNQKPECRPGIRRIAPLVCDSSVSGDSQVFLSSKDRALQ